MIPSLRDYFAARAPTEIPGWFNPKIDAPMIKTPDPVDYVNADVNPKAEDDRRMMEEWSRDPCYDLPDHLSAFQRAWAEYCSAMEWRNKSILENRYFMWRYHYADMMMIFGESGRAM